MAAALLWPSSKENYFKFAKRKILRDFPLCFFTGRVVTADGICWHSLPCWHPLPCGELPPQRLRGLQIGEARKKCNGDDRRQRRIQGGAVGAAVSRTRVPLKARSGRWAPQPVLAKRLAFFRFDFCFGVTRGEQPLVRGSSASKSLALFWFSFVRQKRTFPARRSISRKGRNFFYSTPLQFSSFYGQLI